MSPLGGPTEKCVDTTHDSNNGADVECLCKCIASSIGLGREERGRRGMREREEEGGREKKEEKGKKREREGRGEGGGGRRREEEGGERRERGGAHSDTRPRCPHSMWHLQQPQSKLSRQLVLSQSGRF